MLHHPYIMENVTLSHYKLHSAPTKVASSDDTYQTLYSFIWNHKRFYITSSFPQDLFTEFDFQTSNLTSTFLNLPFQVRYLSIS